MTTTPETRFAKGPDGRIAYQVIGDGPLDLVFHPEAPRAIDVMWDNPRIAKMLEDLSSFSRLILFDMRGFGVSDQIDMSAIPAVENWIDDIRTVMDAVGSERASILVHGLQGLTALLFAAAHPDRVSSMVLFNSFAHWGRTADYPCGMPHETTQAMIEATGDFWGTAKTLDISSPVLAQDPAARVWHGKFERLSMSPLASQRLLEFMTQVDARRVLPNIRLPTLVMHRSGNPFVRPCHGRYLAEHIPGAKFVELPGEDHFWYAGNTDAVVNEVRDFLTGERFVPEDNRVLATVLFVDIVDSTKRAADMGDSRWRDLLQNFQSAVRREIDDHRGHEIDTAGDGYFARFDVPTRAVRCADAIRRSVGKLGVTVRIGLHTGECELMNDGKVGGIAVHIGARVAGVAQSDEILVSSTVKDLTGGSGLQFADRGTHALKGVPGKWPLFAVEG